MHQVDVTASAKVELLLRLWPAPTVPLLADVGLQGCVESLAQVFVATVPEETVVYPCVVAVTSDIATLEESL